MSVLVQMNVKRVEPSPSLHSSFSDRSTQRSLSRDDRSASLSKKPTRIARPSNLKEHKTHAIETNQKDELLTKLKTAFADLIETPVNSTKTEDAYIELIKRQLGTQSARIKRLERALKEQEQHTKDDQDTVLFLLDQYPQAMSLYRQQIEQEQYDQQLTLCIEQFELQKQRMIAEYQRNFDILKSKYRSRFDDIVERMISDPSRLDDEWARRVQRDADERIQEFKRKMLLQQKLNRI
ncbi:hypothetical protein A0J61_01353 [Choanephora cucurbitarum]|uniref:Uncharacterized protein n=1 Tax=Choanephora cucurbitarum TaxID=101091 RepID=A0A1C7NNB6_9FUNG|nr:hypothetical protein A0J61_01353 [Choanephora cucurbitarum]